MILTAPEFWWVLSCNFGRWTALAWGGEGEESGFDSNATQPCQNHPHRLKIFSTARCSSSHSISHNPHLLLQHFLITPASSSKRQLLCHWHFCRQPSQCSIGIIRVTSVAESQCETTENNCQATLLGLPNCLSFFSLNMCYSVFLHLGQPLTPLCVDASEIILKVTRGECQILNGPWFDSNFNTTCRQAFATFDKVVGSWRFARCVGRGALVLQIMVTWQCWHHSGMMTLP